MLEKTFKLVDTKQKFNAILNLRQGGFDNFFLWNFGHISCSYSTVSVDIYIIYLAINIPH